MHFDTLSDTWYSSEPFHCGEVEPRAVSYLDIYKKVGAAWWHVVWAWQARVNWAGTTA